MNLQSKITITLRAEGPGPDLAIRLRRFLKWSLRQAGLRCIQIAEVESPTTPIPGDGKANLGVVSEKMTFARPSLRTLLRASLRRRAGIALLHRVTAVRRLVRTCGTFPIGRKFSRAGKIRQKWI